MEVANWSDHTLDLNFLDVSIPRLLFAQTERQKTINKRAEQCQANNSREKRALAADEIRRNPSPGLSLLRPRDSDMRQNHPICQSKSPRRYSGIRCKCITRTLFICQKPERFTLELQLALQCSILAPNSEPCTQFTATPRMNGTVVDNFEKRRQNQSVPVHFLHSFRHSPEIR